MAKLIFAMVATLAGLMCLAAVSRAESTSEAAVEKMLAQLTGRELNDVIDTCIQEIKAIDQARPAVPQTTARLEATEGK